jgi:hypothetical protein
MHRSHPAGTRLVATIIATLFHVAAIGAAPAATPTGEVVDMARTSLQHEVNSNGLCPHGVEAAFLDADSSVFLRRQGCRIDQSIPAFLSDVQFLAGSGLGQAPRMYAVRNDSTLVGWGDTRCGLLGNDRDDRSYATLPTEIQLRGVTAIANGSWFTIARTSDGGVYTWGLNYEGTLGLGLGMEVPGAIECENEYYPVGHAYRIGAAVTRPTHVPSIVGAVSVAADRVTGYALDAAGNVFEWGLVPIDPRPQPFGTFTTQPVPRKVEGLPPIVALAASHYMKFGLAADGALYGWGPNVIGNFGDGTLAPRLTPTRVPGLANVVDIAGSGDSPLVALLPDGTIRYWGGCCYFPEAPLAAWIRTVPTAPPAGSTPLYSEDRGYFNGTLPAIRHVEGTAGTVLLHGVDGSLYLFPKSNTEQVFVVVSRGASALGKATDATAVEYYNAAFDHYFVTALADEISKLDAGMTAGWLRTGLSFKVYASRVPASVDVCRLFNDSFGARSSHFYSADPYECMLAQHRDGWRLEGKAFSVLSAYVSGACPPLSKPVYRLYNDGRDGSPNHRFTVSLEARDRMLAQGWIAEAHGPMGVAMCSPE